MRTVTLLCVTLAIMAAPRSSSPPLMRCQPASRRSAGSWGPASCASASPRRRWLALPTDLRHPREDRVSQRDAAEPVAGLIDIEHVVARQLVEEEQDPSTGVLLARLGVDHELAAQVERQVLALQAQALRQGARGRGQQSKPDGQGVLERGGEPRVRSIDRKRPHAAHVSNDVPGHELAGDLDAMERAARRAAVKPFGEALDVGGVAEERAGELERLRGRQAVEHDARALTSQRDKARCAARIAPNVLRDDEQDRVLLGELREGHEQTEARVVGVVDVVDRDDERLRRD